MNGTNADAKTDAQELDYVRLLRQLQDTRVAQDLGALMECSYLPDEVANELLKVIASPNNGRWRRRISAAWVAGKADPASPFADAAARRLAAAVRQTRRDDATRMLRLILRATLLAGVAAFFWMLEVAQRGHLVIPPGGTLFPLTGDELLQLLIAVCLAPAVAAMVEDVRLNRVRAACLQALGKLGRKPSIGAALTAAFYDPGPLFTFGRDNVRRAAHEALAALLPALTERDYGATTADDRQMLCGLLPREDEALALAVLGALANVGDSGCARAVSQVAAWTPWPSVRAEAARAGAAIEERRRRTEMPRTLLRSSVQPQAGPDALVRPVRGQSEDPSVMLRPSERSE